MDIEMLKQIIKSNLVSYPLTPVQIEQISEQLLQDFIKIMRDERILDS